MIRKQLLLILSFCIFANISCSSGRIKVKPAPSGGEYEICPVCKGAGVIETYSAKPLQKGLDLTENEKGCADTLGCLFSAFDGLSEDNKTEYNGEGKIKDRREENKLLPESDKHYDCAEQSYVTGKAKCQRCDGIGWISKYETTGKTMDSEQSIEGFKSANEMLDAGKPR